MLAPVRRRHGHDGACRRRGDQRVRHLPYMLARSMVALVYWASAARPIIRLVRRGRYSWKAETMAEERAGTAKNPKTAEEPQVLDDEELTRIVGGTGSGGNNDPNRDGDNDPSTDTNPDTGDTGGFTSPGPWD